MKNKLSGIKACVLLFAVSLILSGCSMRPSPARTSDGKTLFRLGFSGVPESFNPYAVCDTEAETAVALLYDTLFCVDPLTQ